MSKINIFVTLGPSSLNKKFLTYIKNKASLVRLNIFAQYELFFSPLFSASFHL